MPNWPVIVSLILILATLTPIHRSKSLNREFNCKKPSTAISITILIMFFALVSLGITGSSIPLLTQINGSTSNSITLIEGETQALVGKPRAIRSDEWAVITPLVFGQKNHFPPYPIINTNVGIDGQNMLIVGMSGVPVRHIASISKPATWGFFILPTREAMSWYWYFPFFSCLLSLFLLLETINPGGNLKNAGLALIFCTAPYAAGWSNWPLYAAFFPTAMSLIFFKMIVYKSVRLLWLQAILLGVLAAGFLFILYPPWQIALASLYALLTIGFIIDNKHHIKITKGLVTAFSTSFIIACAIALAWWLDSRDAIEAIRATVYPGQRAVLHGVDTPPIMLLWGYSNLETLPNLHGSSFNESEFSSYFSLFPALFYLLTKKIIQRTPHKWMTLFILLFLSLLLIYGIFGFPAWLANLLLWNHMPVHRSHVALGLASIIAIALLDNNQESLPSKTGKVPIITILVITGFFIYLGIDGIPHSFFPEKSIIFIIIMISIGIVMSMHLMKLNHARFITANLILYVATIWQFNPIGTTPANIAIKDELNSIISAKTKDNSNKKPRILIINSETTQAMGLIAAGYPVANATFYYPQKTFWKNFDIAIEDSNVANRYQHLIIETEKLDSGKFFTIEQLSVDTVRISVDSLKFDFNKAGADIVADLRRDSSLKSNSSLSFLGTHSGWNWYAVRSTF